jgi:hypothetical protein
METRDELQVTEAQVRREHIAEVNQWAHWAYLVGVIAIGMLMMIALIALLGAGTGHG